MFGIFPDTIAGMLRDFFAPIGRSIVTLVAIAALSARSWRRAASKVH
jgi:hypothetical protein